MKKLTKIGLLLSVFLYSLPSRAEPCDTMMLPNALLEKLDKEDFSGAEKIALEAAKAAPADKDAQVNLAKVYINSALRPVVAFDIKTLDIDGSKTNVAQKIDVDKFGKVVSDDFIVDAEYGKKAELQIKTVVMKWPESRALLYCLTKIDFYFNDHERFLKSLHRTAEVYSDNEDEVVGFLLTYGQIYYKRHDLRKNSDVYETLLMTFPNNAPLLSSLGVSYLHRGRAMDSVKLFDRAYKLDPEDMIIIGNIGEVSMLVGDFDKAERFLKIKAKMNPKDTAAYFDLAMNSMHKGVKNSLPYWDAYFEQNEKYPDEPQWSHAASIIRKAVQDGMSEADQLNVANQLIEGMKTPKYVIPMMAYLKAQDGSEAAFSYRMGHAYDRGNYFDLAEKALTEAYERLQRSPSKYMDLSTDEILYNLARVAYGQDKYKDALKYLDKMANTDQEKANTEYLYGLTYTKLGRVSEAKKSFELCIKSSGQESLRNQCEQQLVDF